MMKMNKTVTGTFIVHIKLDCISKDFAEHVETRFDISNFEIDRPLNKKKKDNWTNEW